MSKSEPRKISELEKGLGVESHLPRMKTLVIAVVVLVGLILVVWPIDASRRSGWTGGPVSNHHRLIEQKCDRCHTAAFKGSPDDACLGCHTVHNHARAVPQVVAQHAELKSHCASCHHEHHGEQDLIPENSLLCADCHRRIGELLPASAQPPIADFAGHPEFAVQAWTGNPPQLKRVRIGEKGIRDASQLKFSHVWHLGLKPEAGRPQLGCNSCHQATADGKDLEPVSFAKHCESCHALDFDDRLRGERVPHGDARRVFPFVRAEVARLHFEKGAVISRAAVDKESREDEAGLFTEGGTCLMCHDVSPVKTASEEQTRFSVQPRLQSRWMPAAVFEHGTHRFNACERCHAGIRESRSAGDVLLPSINVCRECHADPGTPGKINSPCLQCHAYHPNQR